MDAPSINLLFDQIPGNHSKTKLLRKEALTRLGNKCARCGFRDGRALQIDHVNGNGAEERRKFGKAVMFIIFNKILHGSDEYQILCANCNVIKVWENKERRTCKSVKNERKALRRRHQVTYDLNGYPRVR